MKLGGIDVGTTGCKISVYNELGEFIHTEYEAYEADRKTSEHEVRADIIWQGVKAIIKRATDAIGNIDAIGVTSFGEAFVCLDENDTPLLPSMLYTDRRGEEEARLIPEDDVMRYAGMKPHAMYSIPKAMWIKKNLPEIYNKTKKILLYEDFIVYMLCGVSQIDYSLATRTMGLDINTLTWSDVIFDKAGIDKSLFATPVPSGTVAGKVKPGLGKELGLTDTLIVTGCHDQIAAACGAGVLGVGDAVDGTGTVECITPIFDKIPDNADFYLDNYPVVPHITDGTYATYALSYTGGAAIKWFRDNFAKDISYKDLDAMVKDEPTGILVLPHFAGAASPYRDAYSKAAFVGVTLGTDVGALYRAIMEGVTYEMLVNLEKIKEYGIEPKRLYATGGGASSPVWLQMKADILGLPITPLKAPEVGAVGTVMLVGVAIGAFGSIDEARKILVKEGKTYYPREEKRGSYLDIFSRYKKLYSAVKPLI